MKKKEQDLQLAEAEQVSNAGGDGAIVLDEHDGRVSHKDIGHIEATELDGITINRTKSKIDPFIEIRKERLVDKLTGAPSRAFEVWVPDPEAQEGWRDMGTVSERYLLLTNREVRQLALDVAQQSGLAFRESRIFWDGARLCHILDFVDTQEEVSEGDGVGLSLITRTSYDRSWKFESALMGKRFACDNGLLSGEFFARVSFKHTLRGGGNGDQWKDIVKQGLSVVSHAGDNLGRFAEGLRILKRHPMSDDHLRTLWSKFKLGDRLMGKIMRQYLKHEEPTLYGLLNAGTAVFWHNKKMTSADFSNNDVFVTALLAYAFAKLN